MRDKLRQGKVRVGLMLLVFIVVLIFVGVLMQAKLQTLLRSYVEKQVTQQAESLAAVLEEHMEADWLAMETISYYIQTEIKTESLLRNIKEEEGVSWGLLELGGNAVFGENLSMADFEGVQDSFRGNRAVSYHEGRGLLFTVPVYHNSNVKYVLYKLYDESMLTEKFGVTGYGGQAKVLVTTRDEIVVVYEGWNQSERDYLTNEDASASFAAINEKMSIATAASVYQKGDNACYLFVSEVGDFDLLLVGKVPEYVVAEGLSYIVTLVLWVFGLLLLLLAIGMAFLFGAEEKVKESDELRKAKAIADSANHAKTNFLANMSHEIRTPINAVMGMNEMILRECMDEGIREYAINIQSAGHTLLSLVNDVLDLSKIEAGKMELVESNYRFCGVLNDVVNMIQVKADQKGLDFVVEVDETLPDELYGDEVRIRQIIVNILNNAVKYTKKGSVKLDVKMETLIESGIILKIAVQDTGIGIRQEDMGRLFKDFERLDEKVNRNVEGTGLGLAITSKMLELMKGQLMVDSVYGEGSTFTIYLPQKVVGKERVGNFERNYQAYMKSVNTYKESFVAPTARILVVDDNEMNLFVVKSLLKKTRMEIVSCVSGEEALSLVSEQKFDVLLLDHMMPGMDGIEVLKNIRAMEDDYWKSVPVVALTANAILGVREMYLSEGFQDYISKPIDSENLERVLKKCIPQEKLVYGEEYPAEVVQKTAEKQAEQEVTETFAGHMLIEEVAEEPEGLIDVSLGLQYSAESSEMYREFLKMFCDLSVEKREKIEECYAKQDIAGYTTLVHALKSTSLSIGGKKISEEAAKLEKAGKEGRIEYVVENHEAAMRLYDATVREGRLLLGKQILP